jgi:molecular chaperone DnaK
LKESEGKIPDDVKTEVEGKIKDLKDIIHTAPVEEVKTKTESLNVSLQKIGEAMYKAAGAQGAPGAGSTGESGQTDAGTDNVKKGAAEGEVVE